MPVTIHDVANVAGVSITTVSHVLSGRGRVAEATRERVARVATELGYQANAHAQQLVTRRSRSLAVQVANSPNQTTDCSVVPNSDYFLEVLNGAAEAAASRSYALILIPPEAEPQSLDAFAVDGMILVDPLGTEPTFSAGWTRRRPIVTTGRPIVRKRRVPVSVDNDLVSAAKLMVDHLADNGYARPALITTDTSRSYTADILSGYQEWMSERGKKTLVQELEEPPTRQGAARALGRMLDRKRPPDAIFTSSENLALGVLHEAQRRGIAVPDELGICSAVDSGLLQLTSPQITGMFVYPREVGLKAAHALIDLIEGTDAVPSKIEVPIRLNARASSLRR